MIKAIIWDFKHTVWDPDTKKLIKDVDKVIITANKAGYFNVLVCKDNNDIDIQKILNKYNLVFNLVVTDNDKGINCYKQILDKCDIDVSESLMISERATTDLFIGKQLGLKTIWFRNGKFMDEYEFPIFGYEPDYEVHAMSKLLKYFNT